MARRNRRPLGPLDLRTQAILRAVIEEYVTTATPVGSQALVERYGLGVSSATVRSILAELEANGLLTHPHTSAGRIPTDAGYRFYVESIAEAVPLPAVEQLMIRHQFGQVEFASEHWFRLAATTLASVTRVGRPGHAGQAARRPHPADRPRRDQRADGQPDPRPARGRDQAGARHPRRATTRSTSRRSTRSPRSSTSGWSDLTARRAEARLAALRRRRPRRARSPGASASGSSRSLREYDAAAIEEVFSDGLLNVMEAPEFAQSDKLRRVFSALENRAYLGELVGSVAGAGRVQVFIGHENQPLEMRDVSLVLAPYGRPGPGDRRRRRPRARPGCPTPRRSARSASCPAS